MPHMSNLPWLETYIFSYIMLMFLMAQLYYKSPMTNSKKFNQTFKTQTWKW